MRVIAKRALREFWEKHPDAEGALKAWYAEAKHARWRDPHDVQSRYPRASIIGVGKRAAAGAPGAGRVVFNICGNKYRLVVEMNYVCSLVLIRFVGTHEEYDSIDARTIRCLPR